MMNKKQFEEYLNNQYKTTDYDGWNRASGARTRPYGTWLRNADREMFNEDYRLYLESGKLPS